MSNSDYPTSVIEDLDPEPPPRGSARLWELALGLLLLVGVLGFAGWQWYHQNQQQNDYAAGVSAMSRQDWDEAEADFASAAGYSDADKQAQAVATKIAQRNDNYTLALTDQGIGYWIGCLSAIQQVQLIQPGYKEADNIEQQAGSHVYSEALSGTVALRVDASPPGLYYYGASGWQWLPGSDRYSQVLSSNPSGWIAYDVPGPNWVAQPTPTPQPYTIPFQSLDGRRVMAVKAPDLSETAPISFDPSESYPPAWTLTSKGVWVLRNDSGYTGNMDSPIRSASYLPGETLLYQSYSSPITETVSPGSWGPQALLMGLDPQSDGFLVAAWSGELVRGYISGDNVTNLYLASPSGDRKLLYSITGGSFIAAHFSPDGRHVLLSTYSPLDDDSETQMLVLLSTDGTASPRTIATSKVSVIPSILNGGSPYNDCFWLTAAFVDEGPYSGDFVVSDYKEGHYELRLLDTESGSVLSTISLIDTDPLRWSVFTGQDGEVMLLGTEVFLLSDFRAVPQVPLLFVSLAPNKPSSVTRLVISQNPMQFGLGQATVMAGRLLFSTFLQNDNGPTTTASIFTLPTARFGAQGEHPQSVYSWAIQNGDYSVDGGIFRPDFFMYFSGGIFHARDYGGSSDVKLPHDIASIYDIFQDGSSLGKHQLR